MILSQITSGNQMALRGWSKSTPSKVITIPTEETVICHCDFVSHDCDYEELAFVNPLDEADTFRNDFKAILIDLLDDSSTFEFHLVKSDGTEIALTDGTYGAFYGKGWLGEQPLKVGYRIDWFKVYTLHGGGIYTIRVKQVDFENEVVVESHNIKVMSYSTLAAEGTVKIRTIQKGVNLNGKDYTGIDAGWSNMNRIVAQFGNEQQQNEISRLKDANYKDYDVQIDSHYQYTLSTNLLPSAIADMILNMDTKTDEIFITNYDVFTYRQYEDLEVVATGDVESSEDYRTNKNKHFEITFEDRTKNIKRNF